MATGLRARGNPTGPWGKAPYASGSARRAVILQILVDTPELHQRRLQVLHDLRRQHVGVGEAVAVLQALVLQPEDVQAHLVARQAAVEEEHVRLTASQI